MASRLVKFVGSGIGLAREAAVAGKAPSSKPSQEHESHSREKSGVAASKEPENSDDSDSTDEEGDEEQWELDDAQQERSYPQHPPPPYEAVGEEKPGGEEQRGLSVNEVVQSFSSSHAPRSYRTATARLPCPVVLPQRRPHSKGRGFIRAYAPVLDQCGIDQQTFLDFLDSFDKASKASPIFDVINLAAFAVGNIPEPIVMGVSIAINFAVTTAKEVTIRRHTNTFLNQINDTLFKPRGLFCLIMTFMPESNSKSEPVDISQTVLRYMQPAPTRVPEELRQLRASSGKTQGELEMPEAAPLTFPQLDAMPEAQKQNALKRGSNFIGEYYDRRAQAIYAAQNPKSSLKVAPKPQFASRYSDPNHAANSGSLVSLVTGGAYDPKARKASRKAAKRERRDIKHQVKQERRGYATAKDMRRERRRARRGPNGKRTDGIGGFLRRTLKEGVLYLMVVNLPTEMESRAADAALKQQEASLRHDA